MVDPVRAEEFYSGILVGSFRLDVPGFYEFDFAVLYSV